VSEWDCKGLGCVQLTAGLKSALILFWLSVITHCEQPTPPVKKKGVLLEKVTLSLILVGWLIS